MATSGLILRQRHHDFAGPSHFGCNPGPPDDDDSIHIFLAMGNSLVPMRILTSDTISSVKMRIQSLKRGMYIKQQKLVHDGRELSRDQSRVSDYGIKPSDVIHLVLRVADLLEVVVKSWGGREYVLKIERDPEALRQISEDLDEQSLILRGQRVDDHRLISDLVLQDDAVVHVVASKASAKFRARHHGGETELSIEDQRVEGSKKKQGAEFRSGVTSCCWDQNQLSESILEMISDVNSGLELGLSPVLSIAGTGGTYCMVDRSNKPAAIFKPMDEEPMAENNPRGLPLSISGEGLKRGTRAGEGALREVAAYLLDHPKRGPRSRSGDKNERGFAGVPPTLMIRCSHPAFSEPEKLGSLQKFVVASSNCEDMGPARFSAEQVHRIAILDLRLANTDRNGSNILVCESPEALELVPIDHGYCLPHKFEDCTFEWLWWPQAKAPFSRECLEYIELLDAEEDVRVLEEEGWRIEAEPARVLRVATMLLKRGAAAGLSAFEIGWMMCRERLNDKSEIERMMEEAEACVLPHSSDEAFMETMAQVIDLRIARRNV